MKKLTSILITFLFALSIQAYAAKTENKKNVEHIYKNNADKNPGMKAVLKMLEGFNKIGDNKEDFLDEKISYARYRKNQSHLAKTVSKVIDFWDVCKKSLKYDYNSDKRRFRKDHWKGKSKAQKQKFVNLFKDLIENLVYPVANGYFGNLKIEHEIQEGKKRSAHIHSTIFYKKKDVFMDWYLRKNGKTWVIYDIGVEGERWVTSFRSQFTDIITKRNYAQLLKLMKKKLNEHLDDQKRKDMKALAKRKAKNTKETTTTQKAG